MKVTELREKTVEDLQEMFVSLKKDIENSVNDILKGKEKNIKKTHFMRKDLARVQTILNEKKFLKESK